MKLLQNPSTPNSSHSKRNIQNTLNKSAAPGLNVSNLSGIEN